MSLPNSARLCQVEQGSADDHDSDTCDFANRYGPLRSTEHAELIHQKTADHQAGQQDDHGHAGTEHPRGNDITDNKQRAEKAAAEKPSRKRSALRDRFFRAPEKGVQYNQ